MSDGGVSLPLKYQGQVWGVCRQGSKNKTRLRLVLSLVYYVAG